MQNHQRQNLQSDATQHSPMCHLGGIPVAFVSVTSRSWMRTHPLYPHVYVQAV